MQTTILNTKLTEVIAQYRKSVAKLQKFFKSLESRVDKFALPKQQLVAKREQIRNSCSNLINEVTDVATFLAQMKHQLQAPIPQNMYVAPALRCIMFPVVKRKNLKQRLQIAADRSGLAKRGIVSSPFFLSAVRCLAFSLSLSLSLALSLCFVGLTLQRYFRGKTLQLGEIGTRSCPARCSSLKI